MSLAAIGFISSLNPKAGRSQVDLTGLVCGEDINGDGVVEETAGEFAQCIDGVCPVNAAAKAVDCDPLTEAALCPLAGTLDPDSDLCLRKKMFFFFCPAPYLWNPFTAKCETPPVCQSGAYDPGLDACVAGHSCPLDSALACADIGAGTMQCSELPCVDGAQNPAVDNQADLSSFQADGEIDVDGQCSGSFLVFNGQASECQKAGWSTNYLNCCNDDKDKFWFIEENCSDSSIETVDAKISERAVYVGDYCQKDVKWIGCVQKAKAYCLFSSKLARIVQEQGRPQLQRFGTEGGWGTGENPNCGGFTPEEFQSLDFSLIDFSEFLDDVDPKDQASFEADLKQGINEFFQNQ